MVGGVTDEDIRRYEEYGAIVLRNVFSPSWLQKVSRGIEVNLEHPSMYSEKLAVEEGQGSYFNDYCNWQDIPEFEDFAFNSPAKEIAATLMKSKYCVFYHEHVLNKEPGTTKITPWHHDQPYYPVDGSKVLSIWLPIDPVPKETGVQFLKGSHRWGRWFHPRKFASECNYPLLGSGDRSEGGRVYEDMPLEEINQGAHEILSWSCEPGDCIVFHGLTVHGAPGNTSSKTHRRVLSTRWLGEGTTLATRPWTVSPPILGGLNVGDTILCDTFPLVFGSL